MPDYAALNGQCQLLSPTACPQLTDIRHSPVSGIASQIMGGELGYADLGRVVLDDGPDDVDRQAVASDMTPLLMARKTQPLSTSPPSATHRSRPSPSGARDGSPALSFPSWISSTVSRTSSSRRSPQPRSSPSMARSRLPFNVPGSGRASNRLAWSRVNQFPAAVLPIALPALWQFPPRVPAPAVRYPPPR